LNFRVILVSVASNDLARKTLLERQPQHIAPQHFNTLLTVWKIPNIITTFKSNITKVNRHQLGEFEEIVMLTVGILYKEAYGVAIIDEIESRLNRKVSIGALQTVLRRLEGKGYLKSEFGEATNVRGGKRKRYFSLTSLGSRVLRESQEQRTELFKAIPRVAFPKS
jgi:PadR family transcriptional regulator, regulatory protein PadR